MSDQTLQRPILPLVDAEVKRISTNGAANGTNHVPSHVANVQSAPELSPFVSLCHNRFIF
ncbi:MAG: hypothetical protein ACYC5H_10475 [Methylovirgula sp.]